MKHNALVEDPILSRTEINKQVNMRMHTHCILSPIEVDFINKTVKKNVKDEDQIAFNIDSQVEAFNRIAYNQNVILVHCAMGVSRSATTVIMYLMKRF